MIHINAVEAIWLGMNVVIFVLAVVALMEARADYNAVKALNGRARELVAEGIVRREANRLVVQTLLIAIAVPGIFTQGDISLSPYVLILMAVPAVILYGSVEDARDRKALAVAVAKSAHADFDERMNHLQRTVDEVRENQ